VLNRGGTHSHPPHPLNPDRTDGVAGAHQEAPESPTSAFGGIATPVEIAEPALEHPQALSQDR
jgi:hypothetical protein